MADIERARAGPERVPLTALTARVWQELARAPHDRHHDWRTPVLATQGLGGEPQARTVVLRQANAASRTLTVFTDARSPKCAELSAQPAAQLLFWSARLGWRWPTGAQQVPYRQPLQMLITSRCCNFKRETSIGWSFTERDTAAPA